jgi:hypothetical protein
MTTTIRWTSRRRRSQGLRIGDSLYVFRDKMLLLNTPAAVKLSWIILPY